MILFFYILDYAKSKGTKCSTKPEALAGFRSLHHNAHHRADCEKRNCWFVEELEVGRLNLLEFGSEGCSLVSGHCSRCAPCSMNAVSNCNHEFKVVVRRPNS
jgi:hypothetical protein